MLKEKFNKVCNFVSEHKKALAIGGAVIVGGTKFVVMKSKRKPPELYTIEDLMPKKIEVPVELVKYGIEDINRFTGAIEFTTGAPDYKVTVAELGSFGKNLCSISNITPESKVHMLINVAID